MGGAQQRNVMAKISLHHSLIENGVILETVNDISGQHETAGGRSYTGVRKLSCACAAYRSGKKEERVKEISMKG